MESCAVIVAGFGFRAGAGVASLRDAYARACAGAGVAQVDLLATLDTKAESAAFLALCRALDLPRRALAPAMLQGQSTTTESPHAMRTHGTGSVAEAAALAAAGPGARLLGARVVSADRMATCALAKGETT